MRNSVLEVRRVKSKICIHDTSIRKSVAEQSGGGQYLNQSYEDGMKS